MIDKQNKRHCSDCYYSQPNQDGNFREAGLSLNHTIIVRIKTGFRNYSSLAVNAGLGAIALAFSGLHLQLPAALQQFAMEVPNGWRRGSRPHCGN